MWTVRSVVGEVGRNLRLVHLGMVIALGLILAWAAWFESSSVDRSLTEYHRWLERGGVVYTIERESGIEGSSCGAASSAATVMASGGAGPTSATNRQIRFARSPGVSYSVTEMTRGAVQVISGSAVVQPGWILGRTTMDELGVVPGALLGDGTAQAPVGRVIGVGERQLGYDRDVVKLVPFGTGIFGMCWVELDPSAFGYADSIIAGLLPYDDATIRPFRRTQLEDHPATEYRHRASQHAWIAAGGAAGLFWLLWWWIRRRELALYRSLQLAPSGVLILAMGEALVVTSFAAVCASAVVAWTSKSPDAYDMGLWVVGVAALVSLLLAGAAGYLIARRTLVRATKDL